LPLQTAYFENLETKEKLDVQYNPAELSFNKTAQFAEIGIPGLDSPALQFVRGGNEVITVELFFDTTDGGMGDGARSVTEETDKFYRLVKQDKELHAPPRVRFSWGDPTPAKPQLPKKPDGPPGVPSPPAKPPDKPKADAAFTENAEVSYAPFWFTCVVESVDRKFLLFSPKGVPLRARLTVKLREYKTVEQMAANLRSADRTKARTLKRRERLDQLAADEYDAPEEWRRIADKNNIEDPRRVAPGTIIRIPPIRPEMNPGRNR
jgi:nucleoid-associated protein YgaU